MEPSDELMAFAFFALNHAAESVIPGGGPLIPFALIEVDGRRKLSRCVGELLEEGLAEARKAAASAVGASMAAVAFDGYVTMDGTRMDAVLVEASAAGDASSVILAQRYRSVGFRYKKLERFGPPALIGRGRPLFEA